MITIESKTVITYEKGIEIIKAIPSKFEVPLKKKMDISGEFTVRAHPHDERFSIFYELKVGGYGSQMLQEQSSLHLIPSGVLISGRRPSNVTITGFDYKDYDMMEFIGELIKSGYNWQVENYTFATLYAHRAEGKIPIVIINPKKVMVERRSGYRRIMSGDTCEQICDIVNG